MRPTDVMQSIRTQQVHWAGVDFRPNICVKGVARENGMFHISQVLRGTKKGHGMRRAYWEAEIGKNFPPTKRRNRRYKDEA